MSVVYSATDDDAQIIVQGGADDAFVKVRVTGPGGAVKLRVRVKDGADLGYADFQFDSPEPSLESMPLSTKPLLPSPAARLSSSKPAGKAVSRPNNT